MPIVAGPHAGADFGGVEHRARDEGQDVVLGDETGLDVHLGELELAIGAQVLVAQAASDLVVAVESADHQELLGDLGTLGQHVELTGLQARGHDELARALGRGRPQQRRLDLAESLVVHGATQGGVDAGAQAKVGLHLLAAKVEVAIAQAHRFVDLDAVVELEGRRFGQREYLDLAVGQFDSTGREALVDRSLGSRGHGAA